MENLKTDLTKVPNIINADFMSTEEIHTEIQKGFNDIEASNVQDAVSAFAKFRENLK